VMDVAERRFLARRATNAFTLLLSGGAALFGLAFLAWILWTTISKGIAYVTPALFTQMTPPASEDGGMLNAFAGSLVISTMAILIGTPIGIAAGTWLSQYARAGKLGTAVRFVNDILLSAPSIVVGMFVSLTVVAAMGHGSAIAGALALAMIALPVIVRTTDEMMQLMPAQMSEAALSLGIPQWKVTTQILYRAALPGIVTGVLLAFARISGETAPLLFTSFGNQYWSTDITREMASVPTTMSAFAMTPFDNWVGLAWAAALCMTAFVLTLGLVARAILLRNKMSHD
jgi:phosphate transport system permease protein